MDKAPPIFPVFFQSVEVVARAILPLAGVCLLVLGILGMVTFALLPAAAVFASRGWTPVVAAVEDFAMGEAASPVPLGLRRVTLGYRYVIGEAEYSAQRVGPHGDIASARHGERLRERAAGENIVVWVDPSDHSRAIASRDLQGRLLALALAAAGLALVGGLMVAGGMMMWNDRRSPLRRRKLT